MSEDRINEQQNRNVIRRSRKDTQGRDYICGCGKKYLSYPALYTHIKTKHESKQPEGTQKTGVSSSGIIKRSKFKLQAQQMKVIYSYMTQEDVLILKELENCKGEVPLQYRLRRQHIFREIYDLSLSLPPASSLKITKQSPVDLVLVFYLVNVGRFVQQKLYYQYQQMVTIMRNCYVSHGEQIHQKAFSTEGDAFEIKNFKLAECGFMPIVCDYVGRFYLKHLQKKITNHSLMELLIYQFCKWMKKYSLTEIEITMNKEYKLLEPFSNEPKNTLTPQPNSQIDPDSKKMSQEQGKSESEEISEEEGSKHDELENNQALKEQNGDLSNGLNAMQLEANPQKSNARDQQENGKEMEEEKPRQEMAAEQPNEVQGQE